MFKKIFRAIKFVYNVAIGISTLFMVISGWTQFFKSWQEVQADRERAKAPKLHMLYLNTRHRVCEFPNEEDFVLQDDAADEGAWPCPNCMTVLKAKNASLS